MPQSLHDILLWCDEGRFLGPAREYERAIAALKARVIMQPHEAEEYLQHLEQIHACRRTIARHKAYLLDALGR